MAEALEKANRSQAELARYLGKGASAVNKMIKGTRRILASEADQIRAFLELSTTDAKPMQNHGVRQADANITVPFRSELTRDLPILGVVSGGVGGLAQVENGTAIDYALRPVRLQGRADVAGFWVEDLSMVPAYKPGALVIVEKKRPAQVGDDVIFELLPANSRDDRRAMIKQYAGRTATHYKFAQHNPAKVLEYPIKRVANLMRVIPLSELFGL